MYVDVPDCEVTICHLKDHVRSLLGFPDDASAMLLHEAPSGIAIFSFDESYLNGLAKVLFHSLLMLLGFFYHCNL